MKGMSRRAERVSELIRDEISELLRRQTRDPRLSGNSVISITQVELTDDLRFAKVYVSILGASAEENREAFGSLVHATGFFRHELGQRLSLRYVPEISFKLDTSIQQGDRIMQLLKEIEKKEE